MTIVTFEGHTYVEYDSPAEYATEARRINRVFKRMEELGFEFEMGVRDDCLDYIIRPLLTDPELAAECDRLFAEITTDITDKYTEHLILMTGRRYYGVEGGWM